MIRKMIKFMFYSLGAAIIIPLAVITFSIILRGPMYRTMVDYDQASVRSYGGYNLTDSELIEDLNAWAEDHPDADAEDISNKALRATARELRFATSQSTSNPNGLIKSGKAHCVGYASVYCAVSRHLIDELGLSNKYRCDHLVGHLYMLDQNLHSFINHRFFSNHDYNRIIDLKTREEHLADPSLYDYLRINQVSNRE